MWLARPSCDLSAARHRRAVAVAAVCGMLAAPVMGQDGPEAGQPEPAAPSLEIEASQVAPAAAGPLRVMSWNVASSPYAIAMRKIKSAKPAWRTSFGSERRTVEVPQPPQASDFDVDIVLLQGITNPRALRRLFPARRWRLLLSRRALESLPKGSVFTAPVSSVEVEAVAVRFRQGLRIIGRAEQMDGVPEAVVPPAAGASSSNSAPADGAAAGASQSAPPPVAGLSDATAVSPGLAVKVLDRGRPLWLASVSIGPCDAADTCAKWGTLMRWRDERLKSREPLIAGGRLHAGPEEKACEKQVIETELSENNAAEALPTMSRAEDRSLFGCVAELTLP
jgi:hypothetical protein